jgi:hypothetical protein
MFRRRFAILAIVSVLAACGGGGGGGGSSQGPTAPGTTAPTSAPAGYAKAAFVVSVPLAGSSSAAKWRTAAAKVHATSSTRSPKYIQSGAQSITFTLVKTSNTSVTPGTTSPAYALTPGSPGCTTNETLQIVACTIQIQAPIGEDIYSAQVYASTDGSGTNIGSGATYINVQNNTTNTASLTLAGSLASVYLSTSAASVYNGGTGDATELAYITQDANYGPSVSPARIFVIGLDSQGNQIISPDTFSAPVTLTMAYDTSWENQGDTAHLRRGAGKAFPQGGPTPTPVPANDSNPEDVVQLSVTYASPQNGVSSASTGTGVSTLTIYSPADQVLATSIGNTYSLFSVGVYATASTGPESSTTSNNVIFADLPNQCPPGESGDPGLSSCTSGPTPVPTASPVPTATPTPYPLVWTNIDNYDGFQADGGDGGATFQAGWDPNSTYTGYTFEVLEQVNQGGATVNIDASGCSSTLEAMLPVSDPSPAPPVSTPPPTPGPFTYATTATNPQVTFYVPAAPAAGTCSVTAVDNVTNSPVTLTLEFTEGSITVQKHARKPAGGTRK